MWKLGNLWGERWSRKQVSLKIQVRNSQKPRYSSAPTNPDAHSSPNQTDMKFIFWREVLASECQAKQRTEKMPCAENRLWNECLLKEHWACTPQKGTGGSHSREPGRPMEKGSNGTNLRDPGNVYLITQNPFVNFCELKGTFNQLFSISLLNMNIELKKSSGRKIRTTEKKKLRGKRGRVRNGRKLQESYNYHITSRKQ